MNLYATLMREFDGDLRVSYSAGADAANIATILKCGARPVTACSDLLKPGGYARFGQWLENIEAAMRAQGAANLDEFAADRLANVEKAAADALQAPRYKKQAFPLRPAQGQIGARAVGLCGRPLRGSVRGGAGRARVCVADRAGRVRPGAGGHPGPQPAARRNRLRVHPSLPDQMHAQRL